jgi:hypothetical protein
LAHCNIAGHGLICRPPRLHRLGYRVVLRGPKPAVIERRRLVLQALSCQCRSTTSPPAPAARSSTSSPGPGRESRGRRGRHPPVDAAFGPARGRPRRRGRPPRLHQHTLMSHRLARFRRRNVPLHPHDGRRRRPGRIAFPEAGRRRASASLVPWLELSALSLPWAPLSGLPGPSAKSRRRLPAGWR